MRITSFRLSMGAAHEKVVSTTERESLEAWVGERRGAAPAAEPRPAPRVATLAREDAPAAGARPAAGEGAGPAAKGDAEACAADRDALDLVLLLRTLRKLSHGRFTCAAGDGAELERAVAGVDAVRSHDVHLRAGDARRVDPLVLNLGGGPTRFEGRRRFDLDADGEAEEMARLAGGSAYPALDRNGNGRVDDGRALFGPASGDGFAELAGHDADGNFEVKQDQETRAHVVATGLYLRRAGRPGPSSMSTWWSDRRVRRPAARACGSRACERRAQRRAHQFSDGEADGVRARRGSIGLSVGGSDPRTWGTS
jgi:hypothetical protein